MSILGDPGADKGGEGKSKRAEKCGTKKRKERREEPLGTMSYQTSSKRSQPFWLLIGARKTLRTSGSLIRSLFFAFMPREGIHTCVFRPPRLPSATKTRFAALLLIRGNYFRPYLSIPACAIEGQHTNENSPTISI